MSKKARQEFKAAISRAGRATELVGPSFAEKYNPEQERDEHGRWTAGGGGGDEVTHGDVKAHMDSRSGWTRTGTRPNRWEHENGSKVLLKPDGRGKQFGATVSAYTPDGRLSNMAHIAGPEAPWMVGHTATADMMENLVGSLERGVNQVDAARAGR